LTGKPITLTGKQNSYSFYPHDSNSILKGTGELSSSFIGRNTTEDFPVIIKKLNPRLLQNKNAVERFYREHQVYSHLLGNEARSEVINYGDDIFFVRKFINGINLKDLMKWRFSLKVDTPFAVSCMLSICQWLSKLHQKETIHCDVKPENIIVEFSAGQNTIDWAKPKVHLIDYGLAFTKSEHKSIPKQKLPFSMVYGAPEQMLNFWELVNPTTDLFSLGITIYSLLSRKSPYPESHPLKLMQLQLVQTLPQSKRIPQSLHSILSKLTNKPLLTKPPRFFSRSELYDLVKESQAKRYQNTGELEIDLLQIN
jgi:serine/threonine protein kinase